MHLSIRGNANQKWGLGHSRKFVRKAISHPVPPGYQLSKSKPKPVLDPVRPIIDAWLETDLSRPALNDIASASVVAEGRLKIDLKLEQFTIAESTSGEHGIEDLRCQAGGMEGIPSCLAGSCGSPCRPMLIWIV